MQPVRNRSFLLLGLVSAVCTFSAPHPVSAANEAASKSQLEETRKKLEQSKKKQQELKSQAEKLGKELKPLKNTMVTLAEKIQKQEQDLGDLEDKITILETEKSKKLSELANRQKQLEASLMSMIKLSKMPPEAVVAMPGNMDHTMKAAHVLRLLTDSLHQESESLKGQLRELDALENKLSEGRSKRDNEKKALEKTLSDLSKKIAERTKLQESLFGEQRRESQKIAEFSKQSKTLQNLVESLEKNRKARAAEEDDQASVRPSRNNRAVASAALGGLRSFVKSRGRIRMPVAGSREVAFGAMKERNQTSRGIEIRARSGASVVAPFDGEVVFTGPFMDYGRMVILRHTDGYHTLLAGFERIECAPGDVLKEGEPIGTMGTKTPSNTLYLELRKDNRPIDPGPWIRS